MDLVLLDRVMPAMGGGNVDNIEGTAQDGLEPAVVALMAYPDYPDPHVAAVLRYPQAPLLVQCGGGWDVV